MARVVVAVDYGTTFSGFAYARTSEPDEVFKFYDWAGASAAGAKPYCKTQTSLFYAPSPTSGSASDAPLQLQSWGWSSFLAYTTASQTFSQTQSDQSRRTTDFMVFLPDHLQAAFKQMSVGDYPESSNQGNSDMLALSPDLAQKVGFFATKFKLFLAPDAVAPKLPGGLTVEKLVVDYLRCLSSFIMSELQVNYGSHFSMKDVQWCLTVPAIWDERAKQAMKAYAEEAGMVRSASSSQSAEGSPFPLDIILEPEAASVYCQHKAKVIKLRQGDKLLVADVGGGTIDLVVHEKADSEPESLRVHEVVSSYGELGGGTFVDANFFGYLCKKIGCFGELSRSNKAVVLAVYRWWQGVKAEFDGEGFSAVLGIPAKLRKAWEEHDRKRGVSGRNEDDYDELRLEGREFKAIFDPEVDKVIRLIKMQVEGVRLLMVVGGFSASPYLRHCVMRAFEGKVEEILIPMDPGGAICHGAVQLHLRRGVIQSRIAKRTYGVRCSRAAQLGDPFEKVFLTDDGKLRCEDCFDIFVKAGDRVPLGASFTESYRPGNHAQSKMPILLFSSPEQSPAFTSDDGVVTEGSFIVDISEDLRLDKDRAVEITMVFGASHIVVTAERANFGKSGKEQGLSVAFQRA